MVSREQKRTALHEKLQLLRSITNSHAVIPLHYFLISFLSLHFLHEYSEGNKPISQKECSVSIVIYMFASIVHTSYISS